MNSGIGERLFKTVFLRWSKPLTIALIVLAAVGVFLGTKVQLKLSLTDLLPEKHPSVLKFEKLTEVVGGVGYLAVILEADDRKSHLDVAPRIVERLRALPVVRSVFYHREERFFVDRMLYYLDLARLQELDRNIGTQITSARRKMIDLGLFDDEEKKDEPKAAFDDELKNRAKRSAVITPELISPDRKHLLIMMKPDFDSTDFGKTKALIASTEEILRKELPAGVRFEFAERYYNKIVETELIQNDIFLLGTLSILSIALMLLIYLRSFRALCVIFAPVFLGLGITTGLTYLCIGHINIITGFLMGIVSGLGVDYGIHLLLRLQLEQREPSSADPDAVSRTLHSSGHSVFIGAMAAAFAFYLLCFSDFRAFSEFGFICGTGITAVLFCLLACFSALARWLGLDRAPAKSSTEASSRWQFPVLSLPRGFIVGLVLTAGLVAVSPLVRFEYDFTKMMQHSAKMEELSDLVDAIYGRSSVPSALSVKSKEEALAIEKMLKERYIPALVKEYISGASIVPENQEEKRKILLSIKEQLRTVKDKFIEKALDVPAASVRGWMDAKPFGITDLPSHIQDALRGTKQEGFLLYLYPAIKLGDAPSIRRYATMIKDVETQFPNVLTGSDAVIFSDILDLIHRDGGIILIVIFLSVGFFIWLNVRKWDDTLLSYLPLLVALPVGMGLMVLTGVKFNIFNIAIIPTFVAMGIDVPIHIVHRTRETGSGFKAARDLAASINLALMTAAVGFGVLIFARVGVLKSLGWISLLATAAIWWVGLLVLPAMLEWVVRRGPANAVRAARTATAKPEPTP